MKSKIHVLINHIDLRKSIKIIIIIVVLMVSFISYRFASPQTLLRVLLFMGGGVAVVFLINNLSLGLIALIPISFLLPWNLGTGTKVPLNGTFLLTILLIGLWIFRMAVEKREIRLVPSRVNIPALMFIFATVLSLIAGNINWIPFSPETASLSAQLGAWLLYTLSVCMLLMVGNTTYNVRWLRYLTWIYLALGGIYIIGYSIPNGWFILKYFVGSSGGSVMWVWIAALAFGQVLGNHQLSFKWRITLGLLVLLEIYAGWFQGHKEWVSGWLPPLVAIFVILWLRSWRWGLMISFLAGFLIIIFFSQLQSQVMTSTQTYSVDSREWTLPILYNLIKYSPVFGLGPANYYHYTSLYSINGFHVVFNSHDNYMDILAQYGVVGFVLFIWLACEIGYLGWKLRKRVQDGFSQGYIMACLGGLAGMLVSGFLADWFLPFLYNIGIAGFRASIFAWIFLGGLISLNAMTPSYQGQKI